MSALAPPRPSLHLGRLPDFLVIGTKKGGTSALFRYLSLHPQVSVSREKELNFFFDRGILPDDPRGFERGSWHLGEGWYRRWFQTDRQICGEASPSYSLGIHAKRIAPRIAAVTPRARLIYLVRHPLERLRSEYRMVLKRPRARHLSFSEFIASPPAIATSCYGSVLATYRQYFDSEQILVLESSSLDNHRPQSLAKVFRFLGVDDQFWCRSYNKRIFVGSRRPFVSPAGKRVRDAATVQALRHRLPPAIFYHVENLLLSSYRVPELATILPRPQATELIARLTMEMALLRSLTGQRLSSLDVNLNQALLPNEPG